MKRQGMLLNMGTLVGHGSLRIAASGLVTRLLTRDEQARLERYLEQALEMGCMGLSTGLQYFPGLQSDTAELVGLGGILKRKGGVFTSHLRSYAHTVANAIDEVSEVGRRCGVPVQISHLYWQPYAKGLGWVTRNAAKFGSFAYNKLKIPVPIEKGLEDKIELVEAQRRQGVDIAFDLVPTSQGFTELFAFLPPYVVEGSKAEALSRLADKAFRKKVRHDILHVEPDWPHRDGATWSFNYIKMTGWEGLRVMAVMSDHNRWMEGLTFLKSALNKARKRSMPSVISWWRKRARSWYFIHLSSPTILLRSAPCGRDSPIHTQSPGPTQSCGRSAGRRMSSTIAFRASSPFSPSRSQCLPWKRQCAKPLPARPR